MIGRLRVPGRRLTILAATTVLYLLAANPALAAGSVPPAAQKALAPVESMIGALVAIIPAPEYDRLRALARAVSWFRGAGLDLAAASEQQVIDFVRTRREQTGGAQQQAAG